MNAIEAIRRSDHFELWEFPRTVDRCRPELIDRLDDLRALVGSAIHPSRHPDGWVRESGSTESMHHVSNAMAGDVFPAEPLAAFLFAIHLFGGVGIYYDTRRNELQPGAMLHVDLRPGLVIWCRHEGRYIFPANSDAERAEFWRLANLYARGEI